MNPCLASCHVVNSFSHWHSPELRLGKSTHHNHNSPGATPSSDECARAALNGKKCLFDIIEFPRTVAGGCMLLMSVKDIRREHQA